MIKKLNNWLPFILSVILALGMFIGYQLANNTKGKFFARTKHSSINEVSDIIKQHYVDSLNVDSLTDKTIEELILKLDPHSSYIPAALQSDALRDIKGLYKGLGVEFLTVKDTLHIIQILPNSPAEKAGFELGDKILTANQKVFTGNTASNDSLRQVIQGNAEITFTILRNTETKTIIVKPEIVVINSIDNAIMLNDKIGYIKINNFSERTYEDFMAQLEALLEKKMQHLVIDLRGNGGGLLDEAVDIEDMLVGGTRTLCSMRGAHFKEQKYISKRDGIFEDEAKQKIVVLVDEFSASASECLAGSLQDLDRAYIIGTRTYGKGLVMQDFALSNGASIRLTVGRYYLPSGRCIQKPYTLGNKNKYDNEIIQRHINKNLGDSLLTNLKSFKTLKGNEVFDGSGISPNFIVRNDYPTNGGIAYLATKNKLAYLYSKSFNTATSSYKNAADFINAYNPNAQEIAWLKSNLLTNEDSIKLEANDYNLLLKDIALTSTKYYYKKDGYYQALQKVDKPIAAAVNYLMGL